MSKDPTFNYYLQVATLKSEAPSFGAPSALTSIAPVTISMSHYDCGSALELIEIAATTAPKEVNLVTI